MTTSDFSMATRSIRRTGFGALFVGLVASTSGTALAQDYAQAPMLDAMVEAGDLPPVTERLPENPFVETMIDGVGRYGGTLRTTILANGDHYNLTRTTANELLVRWDPTWTEVVPSMAEEITASDDATTYTFKLREGMHWSDGAPFTADDIVFWYEDVFMNEALTPSRNPTFVVNGEPVVVRKIDDLTVEFAFPPPQPLRAVPAAASLRAGPPASHLP